MHPPPFGQLSLQQKIRPAMQFSAARDCFEWKQLWREQNFFTFVMLVRNNHVSLTAVPFATFFQRVPSTRIKLDGYGRSVAHKLTYTHRHRGTLFIAI